MANNNSDWDKMICDFINEYNFTSSNTEEEILAKINEFLQERYKGKATKAHIKHVAEDVTESVCLKLGVPC